MNDSFMNGVIEMVCTKTRAKAPVTCDFIICCVNVEELGNGHVSQGSRTPRTAGVSKCTPVTPQS
jgi:hypothetical protein